MLRLILLLGTHIGALAIGFALGVYLLPILTAAPSPDAAVLSRQAEGARFTAKLTRDLRGSDALHWGEGKISITANQIVHEGRLAPGPDYRLYLVDRFVDHEDAFQPIKAAAKQVGLVNMFDGFVIDLPADIDPAQYNTVLVWCEAFSEFITAAQYR